MNGYFRPTLAIALWALLGTSAAMAAVNVRIPVGTSVQVRITEKLSSETANVGDVFHGSLAVPVVANGRTLFPKGAIVTGEVVNVERSGRLSTPGELELSLRTIRTGGRTYPVVGPKLVHQGRVPHQVERDQNRWRYCNGSPDRRHRGRRQGSGHRCWRWSRGRNRSSCGHRQEACRSAIGNGARVGSTGTSTGNAHAGARFAGSTEATPNPKRKSITIIDDIPAMTIGMKIMTVEDRCGFSDRDRQIIGDCFVNDRAGLPPGLAKKDRLPPGLERQLQRNGTLPPGLQKRVQPLPGSCVSRLPRLPHDWAIVVLSGRIILLDPGQRIVDLFWLN